MAFTPLFPNENTTVKPTPSFTALGTEPTSQPSFLQKVGGAIKDILTPQPNPSNPTLLPDLQDIWTAPPTQKTPITLQSVLNGFYGDNTKPLGEGGGFVGDVAQAWVKTIDDLNKAGKATKPLDQITTLAQTGLDAIGAFFQPVASVIKGATTIPGRTGDVADYLNRVFDSVGKVGGDTLGQMVQDTNILTPEQKAKIVPIAQQLGSLGLQIAAGKVGADTFSLLKDTTHDFLTKSIQAHTIENIKAGNESISTSRPVVTPTEFIPKPTPSFEPIRATEAKPITEQPTIKPVETPITSQIAPTAEITPKVAEVPSTPEIAQIQRQMEEISTAIPKAQKDLADNLTKQYQELNTKLETLKAQAKPAEVNPVQAASEAVDKVRTDQALQSLAQEAQKYKSAEQFSKVIQDNAGIKMKNPGIEMVSPADIKLTADQKNFTNYGADTQGKTTFQGKNYTQPPIIVDESMNLLDGRHRLAALKESGATRIPVLKENGSQSLTDFYNKVKGKNKPVEAPTASAPKPVETTAKEQLTSRVFERLKAENPSIEGDLGYDPIKLKEDAQKAVDLVASDKQKAFRIAMGAETSTEVTSTAVNIAMAEKALSDGNYSLYSRLIRNRSLEQTRRGQEIVAERGSVTDNSTSRYVKELVASRLETLGKKYLSGLTNKLKGTTDKGKGMKALADEVVKVEKQIKAKKLTPKDALTLLDKIACV